MPTSDLQSFGLFVWPARPSPDHSRPHRHNEIELNYIESGAITYVHAGNEIRIQRGESVVFWGAVPHQLVQYEAGTVMDIATVPLEDVLQWHLPPPFVTALLSGVLFHTGRDTPLPYGAAMYRQWQSDVTAGESSIALMEIKAFLHRCARWHGAAGEDKTPPAAGKAQAMARFMSGRFREPISAREAAAHANLHPHYAMVLFKSVFGMTMIEYLTQQRIACAQQRLLTSDDSVIDIAYEAGFRTLSHFYSAFKRLCGMSPGKYRAALRRAS